LVEELNNSEGKDRKYSVVMSLIALMMEMTREFKFSVGILEISQIVANGKMK
jgi:hypothetical protein